MTRRATLLALAALLAACGEPYPSTIYLAPEDATLAALAVAADKRWEAAGAAPERVVVVPRGTPGAVPLRWQPTSSIRRVCRVPDNYYPEAAVGGCVEYNSDEIPKRVWLAVDASQGCMDHEMGHLLGVVDHISAAGALMREDSGSWQITEADLEAVCSAGDCTGWTPEVAL